jgi:hypothetical protein
VWLLILTLESSNLFGTVFIAVRHRGAVHGWRRGGLFGQCLAPDSIELRPLRNLEPVLRFSSLAIFFVDDLGRDVLLSWDDAGWKAERHNWIRVQEVEERISLGVDHVIASKNYKL